MKTSAQEFTPRTGEGRHGGFTLIELLVIIAMLAVLACLHVTAHAGARDRSKVAQCAANVKQLTLTLLMYGGENNNKLPVLSSSGSVWAWDLPWSTGDALMSYGLEKRTFYCPGTGPAFTDKENFQDVTVAGRNLWDYGKNFTSPFHITGYLFALSGTSMLVTSNKNTSILSEPVVLNATTKATAPAPPNAERVLIACAIVSDQLPAPGTATPAMRATYNFSSVLGGFYKPHQSPHLKGNYPTGGNLGFKDGHVGWRKFDDMDQRALSPSKGFWW